MKKCFDFDLYLLTREISFQLQPQRTGQEELRPLQDQDQKKRRPPDQDRDELLLRLLQQKLLPLNTVNNILFHYFFFLSLFYQLLAID